MRGEAGRVVGICEASEQSCGTVVLERPGAGVIHTYMDTYIHT